MVPSLVPRHKTAERRQVDTMPYHCAHYFTSCYVMTGSCQCSCVSVLTVVVHCLMKRRCSLSVFYRCLSCYSLCNVKRACCVIGSSLQRDYLRPCARVCCAATYDAVCLIFRLRHCEDVLHRNTFSPCPVLPCDCILGGAWWPGDVMLWH